MARRARCALCGRELDNESEAIRADDTCFCSQSHLLEYESRPQRRRPGGTRLLAVAVSIVIVAAGAYAFVSGRQASRLPAWQRGLQSSLNGVKPAPDDRWAHPGLAGIFLKIPATPRSVKIDSAGYNVAWRFLVGLYIDRDCRTAMASADHAVPAFVADCPSQLKTIENVDYRLIRRSVLINRDCGNVVSVVRSTQCVSYEIIEPNPHTPAGYINVDPNLLQRLAVYVWPSKDGWRVEGTTWRGSSGGTYPGQQLWNRAYAPK